MTRTEAEYARALQRLEDDKAYLERLEATLGEADLTQEERERALQPALAFTRSCARRSRRASARRPRP